MKLETNIYLMMYYTHHWVITVTLTYELRHTFIFSRERLLIGRFFSFMALWHGKGIAMEKQKRVPHPLRILRRCLFLSFDVLPLDVMPLDVKKNVFDSAW